MATRNAEWAYMDTLRPPVYVCLRRKGESDDGSYPPFKLDGRIDKDEWSHVPWSDPFVDIEGTARQPQEYPLTRFKMMHDTNHLYIGAELIEPKIWGTIKQQNATLYHENDFEVFLNPDGSRHNYYELELNCLNTIWELVLNRPYKDGYSIQNPYNLQSTKTAVYVDGLTNSPLTECHKWCVEVAFDLQELVQFDTLRHRPVACGDIWRVNFSRVQHHLRTVVDDETKQLTYIKIADSKEQNIVWAPTGVIDIHRPEKWGVVLFTDATDEHDGLEALNDAMDKFLCEQLAMERILDTIYYDQRAFYETHESYAASLEQLYAGETKKCPWMKLVDQFQLDLPRIQQDGGLISPRSGKQEQDMKAAEPTERRKRSYVPKLDDDDEDDEEDEAKSQDKKKKTAAADFATSAQGKKTQPAGLLTYTVSVASATQQWSMAQDARLWKS